LYVANMVLIWVGLGWLVGGCEGVMLGGWWRGEGLILDCGFGSLLCRNGR